MLTYRITTYLTTHKKRTRHRKFEIKTPISIQLYPISPSLPLSPSLLPTSQKTKTKGVTKLKARNQLNSSKRTRSQSSPSQDSNLSFAFQPIFLSTNAADNAPHLRSDSAIPFCIQKSDSVIKMVFLVVKSSYQKGHHSIVRKKA